MCRAGPASRFAEFPAALRRRRRCRKPEADVLGRPSRRGRREGECEDVFKMSVGLHRRPHQERRELEIDGIDETDMRQRRIGYRDDRNPWRSLGKPGKAPVHLVILHRLKTSFEPIGSLTLLPHGVICHAGRLRLRRLHVALGVIRRPLPLRLGAMRTDARSAKRESIV